MLCSKLIGAFSSPPPTVVATAGSQINLTNGTSFTFTSVNYGGPGLIVVSIHGGQGSTTAYTVTSCTIGGVSATLHVNPSAADSCAIASVVMASGSTANIVVNVSTTLQRMVVFVHRITGYLSSTPVATANTGSGSAGQRTINLNTSDDGVAVFGATHAANTSFTWSNASESFDYVDPTETSNAFTGARSETTGGTSAVTVTAASGEPAVPGEGYVLAGVSWR